MPEIMKSEAHAFPNHEDPFFDGYMSQVLLRYDSRRIAASYLSAGNFEKRSHCLSNKRAFPPREQESSQHRVHRNRCPRIAHNDLLR